MERMRSNLKMIASGVGALFAVSLCAAFEVVPTKKFTDQDRQYWAFQPVRRPTVPPLHSPSGAGNPIDAFIWQKLKDKGIEPGPPADKITLIRRVTFDLTGLPPTPEEVDAFVADKSPDAYEKVVDRLLVSPHYGERWARHWL